MHPRAPPCIRQRRLPVTAGDAWSSSPLAEHGGGTGIAFVIYYTLNHAVGPTRTSLVAYIAPVFAVVYGVTLRGESFGVATAVGIALIVGGSWLAANTGRRPARVREVPAGASSPVG